MPVSSRAPAEPSLGVTQVLLAYLLLAAGFFTIGVASQTADQILGLWITEALAIALPALIWIRASGVELTKFLGFRMPKKRWLAAAVLTCPLNQPVVSTLTWIAQSTLPHSIVERFEAKNAFLDAIFGAHPYSMLAAVAIAASIGEELFFRGFALPAAARSMRPVFAAVLTAALFSAMHLDVAGALGLFEIGLWLAVLRWGSGSLWPAMLGHALNNALAGSWFLLGLQTTGRAPPDWAVSMGIDNPDAPPPAWVLLIGGVLLALGIAAAIRIFSRPMQPAPMEQSSEERRPIQHKRAWPLWAIWGAAAIAGAVALLRHR